MRHPAFLNCWLLLSKASEPFLNNEKIENGRGLFSPGFIGSIVDMFRKDGHAVPHNVLDTMV
jgi:hypothetical protein